MRVLLSRHPRSTEVLLLFNADFLFLPTPESYCGTIWGDAVSEPMKIEPREYVLLIRCSPADVRLIYKTLTPTTQRFLETKSVSKVADALERIINGGIQAIIMDIESPE